MPLKENYAISSIISCQLSLVLGAAQGFSGILLPQLRESMEISKEQISWIASLGVLCRPIGAIVEGYLVDKIGRKRTMQIVSFFFILSWAFTALSTNINFLCASRILLSFTTGMAVCVGLYIAEITTPQTRGTFLSLITPTINSGILLVYLLGYLLHWKMVAVILIIYSAIILFTLSYVSESHIWFMLKNKKSKAANVLLKFRNDNLEIVDAELEQIRLKMSKYKDGDLSFFKNLRIPAVWKPFIIFSVFSFFQQQTGYNIIIYYGGTYFENLGGFRDKYILTIIFASISIIGSVILVLIVHKFNRVTLLVSSGLGMAVTMAIGAISLSWSVLASQKWIPVMSTFAYIFCCMLGMIDIPWMMIGEIFPNRMRGAMSSTITVVIFLISFLNIKMYLAVDEYLGTSGVLWYFTVLSLITVIFAKLFFPETKGKALTEIEDFFQK